MNRSSDGGWPSRLAGDGIPFEFAAHTEISALDLYGPVLAFVFRATPNFAEVSYDGRRLKMAQPVKKAKN